METRSWDVDDERLGNHGNHPTIAGESNGINQLHHIGKIMGRSWEDHGKIMGRSWEDHGVYIYYKILVQYIWYIWDIITY